MLDAQASRQAAHIFLDAAAIHHPGDMTADDERDDMTALALQRLGEVGAIRVEHDAATGRVAVDIARAQTGILALITACLDGWASCQGLDRDEVIAEVRRIVDEQLVDD